jgi:hypothetical protein
VRACLGSLLTDFTCSQILLDSEVITQLNVSPLARNFRKANMQLLVYPKLASSCCGRRDVPVPTMRSRGRRMHPLEEKCGRRV